jgi:uncharacterized protein (DUF1800 family)
MGPLTNRSLSVVQLLGTVIPAVFLLGPADAAVDNGLTQTIWRIQFGVSSGQLYLNGLPSSGLNPTWTALDDDADGTSNGEELAAGTSPFDSSKSLNLSNVTSAGASTSLAFPTQRGKIYRIESNTSLVAPAGWILQSGASPAQILGDGQPASITVPFTPNTFYRVRVEDIDRDNDELCDWVEHVLGLNPLAAQTSPPLDDKAYVIQQLGAPDEVQITATRPFASEDGPESGRLTVTRRRALFPLFVDLTYSGTAQPTVDYPALPGVIAFAAGVSTVNLNVNPATGDGVEGSESVTATIMPSVDYTVVSPGTATVIIKDSTAPFGTGLLARYYDHANSSYAHAANFGDAATYVYTRDASTTSGSIVVTPGSSSLAGLTTGHSVKLSFTSGGLNSTLYNDLNYTVSSRTDTSFTVSISSPSALPVSGSGACNYSIQSFPHPAVIERVDPVVNFDWMGGTANGNAITPGNSPDNYSSTWEGFLHPATAGVYQFQLDADDKARILLDIDRNGVFDLPSEQIVEHGWGGPATVGTFKQSAGITLAVPASASARYRIRVEHVETSGEARCRVQWRLGSSGYGTIPQAEVFSHTMAMSANYNYTRNADLTSGSIVVSLTGHTITVGEQVPLYFSSGNLFTPPSNYHGTYTVTAVTSSTFTVNLSGAGLPGSGTGAGFVGNRPTSTTTGWLNQVYANTTFASPPGRVGIDGTGATTSNSGLYGTGTPDPTKVAPDLFSVRWSGQVQPQFSEEYTFAVLCDDGATLRINGQVQPLLTAPSTSLGGSTYAYDQNGETLVNYSGLAVRSGSFLAGETVRLDPTSGNLTHGNASTYTYDGATGLATINYSNLTNVTPGSIAVGDTVELDPTTGSLSPLANSAYVVTASTSATVTVNFGTGVYPSGSGNINLSDTRNLVISSLQVTGNGTYNYNATTGLAVIDYAAITALAPGSVTEGSLVRLDPTSGNLSPVALGLYSVTAVSSTTITVDFGTGTYASGTGSVLMAVPVGGSVPSSASNAFMVNFGANRYAPASSGSLNVEVVNKALKDWSSMGNERYVRIQMVGGVRYDIQLDYWESGGYSRCLLYWFSPSQPRQIIPSSRLYPSGSPASPPNHLTSAEAEALVGGPVQIPVGVSNGASVSLSGGPSWLSVTNGVITGTPPAGSAGNYQVLVTISNPVGTSTSLVNLRVQDTGSAIARETWFGIPGNSVASIPFQSAPGNTSTLTSLETPSASGDNYGVRIRGYLTAPLSGNYYFWISGADTAELWISNDHDPVNAIKRAWVTNGTAPKAWQAEPAQKSPWLALKAGQRYYIEILQKASVGPNDSLAVGWLRPGETGEVPSGVVPGYVLSPYIPPAPGSAPGTLYVATMLSQNGAVTKGVGSSTLRLSQDEKSAVMTYSYRNLTGPITSQHIHTDPYLNHPSTIIYDIDTPSTPGDGVQVDGSYKWTISAVGTLSQADIVEIIKQGKAYVNLHTAMYPAGEIRGNYTLASGSRTFTPPPAPPQWVNDSNTDAGAARFLAQAAFGASAADIAALKAMPGYEAWIDDQFTKPATLQLPEVIAREMSDASGGSQFAESLTFNAWWRNSVTAPDQLRQKVAFALSQIHVVSAQGPLDNRADALSHFYDRLATNAFGNFRDILVDTTLTPAMGRYLDMLRNDKPDVSVGRIPNENYAREIKQLFSIGLFRMWPDGTLVLNANDSPIDTYTQEEIVGFAHVFTGWDYGYDGPFRTSLGAAADWTRLMREVPARHFTGPKRVLNNEVLPGLPKLGGQPLDPFATHTSVQFNDPAYQNLPAQELSAAHDQLFNHPNVGPFICRQLIQRMVTSHPSRDYLYRVVQKFNDNGSGVRGDMKSVIKAILLDYEARSAAESAKPAFGKQREPLQRVANVARAFRRDTGTGTFNQANSHVIAVSMPNRFAGGNSVFLEFPRAGAFSPGDVTPTSEAYTVLSTPAPTPSLFHVNAKGWTGVSTTNGTTNAGFSGTYSQVAGSSSITVTISGHWLGVNQKAFLDFGAVTTGTALADGVYTALTSTSTGSGDTGGTTFTIAAPNTTARSGYVRMVRFQGSYTVSNSGLASPQDKRITLDTTSGGIADHHLVSGNRVFLNFTLGNPQPTDGEFVIESVPDANTFTVLTSAALATGGGANGADNGIWMFPLVNQPLTRSGNVNGLPSTFLMGNTTGDLEQSPLNSPTVFNFFHPDYKFPGSIAAQGITTPEFEITAETTAIRQANFLFNGVFNPGNTNGLSSFRSGTNALVLDLSPWMGPASDVGLGAGVAPLEFWTSDANLGVLIDRLNTLLLAGQLTSQSKAIIQRFLQHRTLSGIAAGNPCTITAPSHGWNTGDVVTISGVTGGSFSPAINGSYTITVTGPSTFRIPVNCISTTGLNVSAGLATVVPYTNAAPSETNRRDRLRAVLHLILTSPDFTIQR